MIDIILITPDELQVQTLKYLLEFSFNVSKHSHSEGFVITGILSSLIIEPGDVESYYSVEEIETIRAHILDPRYYIVRFRHDEERLLEKVLSTLSSFDDNLLLDDDHGHIVRMGDFLRAIRDNYDINWMNIIAYLSY